MVADVVVDHGGWGIPPVGSQPGGKDGLVHGIPYRPKPKTSPLARSRRPRAAAPPRTPGCLYEDPGGNPPHPRHARHGMLCVF